MHIHLLHLKEAKPSEMPVRAATKPRLLTSVAMQHTLTHTHTHTHTCYPPPSPLSFFTPQLSSLPAPLRLLCFITLGSTRFLFIFFIEGLHLAVLGALLLVQSLSLISNLLRLSVGFYVQGFFFYLHLLSLLPSPHVCCRRAFIPTQLLTKSYSERQPPKAVPSLRQTPSVNILSPQKICCAFFFSSFFFARVSKGTEV